MATWAQGAVFFSLSLGPEAILGLFAESELQIIQFKFITTLA